MVYYRDGKILVRNLEEGDVEPVTAAEREQGWDATPEKLRRRLQDQRDGKAIALAAEYEGTAAGYINVYPDSVCGAFGGRGLPEIVDFAVLEKYRAKGTGTALMEVAENISAEYADTVYLGVGLHSGYGSAQRMYVKRGYIPDGSGVWYRDAVCSPYGDCRNDDDLVLYLSKKLR